MENIVNISWNFIKSSCNWIHQKLTLLNILSLLLIIFCVYGFRNYALLNIIIWPTLISILIISFKSQISSLIDRINLVKLPGGTEIAILQEQKYDSNNPKTLIKKYENIIEEQQTQLHSDKFTQEQLIQLNAIQDIIIDFERIYHLIFKSQITLLLALKQEIKAGIHQPAIENYFQQLKSKWPLIYSNWTWQNYIDFLLTRKLIMRKVDNIDFFIITEYGVAFLDYITRMNYQPHLEF